VAVALTIAASACTPAPAAEPRPEPEPPSRVAGDSADRPRVRLPGIDYIPLCVLQNGNVREVRARYDTQTGDTTVDGRPFGEVFPPDTPGYAASASWMILNEPIPFRGYRYIKYGRPRVFLPREVEPAGEYQGTPLFTEAGTGDRLPALLLVPVRPGCEFQTYQTSFEGNAVRG
jgi:hypothetical protein